MNFREQLHKARFGPICRFGGDSSSQANTTSNTTNNNNITTHDKRVVASDAAVALSGDNSSLTKNDSTTTTFTDNSNRSTNFNDSSNRSTSFSDSSQRDSGNTTNVTTTDFGSVSKALDSVTMMGKAAVDLGDHSVTGAIASLQKLADDQLASVNAAFDVARGASADSVKTAQSALSFAQQSTALTNQAFAEAKNGPDTNKTVMYVALGVLGIVGVGMAMMMMKKG